MWKRRAVAALAILAVIVGIIMWNSGSTEREANAALATRFHRAPKIMDSLQIWRGITCGSYRLPAQQPNRFIYVSHYSDGDSPEGLLVAGDANFQSTFDKRCQPLE